MPVKKLSEDAHKEPLAIGRAETHFPLFPLYYIYIPLFPLIQANRSMTFFRQELKPPRYGEISQPTVEHLTESVSDLPMPHHELFMGS